VFVDSTRANNLFAAFMDRRAGPGLEDHGIVRREPSLGKHRFDFELADDRGQRRLLEVKSCTLAWNDVASFPDAVSSRALEHVRLLSRTPRGLLVFLLMHERITTFVPNYHTDFAFYRGLQEAAPLLDIRAYCLELDDALRPEGVAPVTVTIPHVDPCGAYIMVFHDSATPGALSSASARDARDCLVVAGVDRVNVFAAMARMKKMFYRARHGRGRMKARADYPLLGPAPSMDEMGALLEKLGGSDVSLQFDECAGTARVFHCREHPGRSREFWDVVLRWRFGGFSRS
jgi:hypothetical protein